MNREAAGTAKSRLEQAVNAYGESQKKCEELALELYEVRRASSQDIIGPVERLVNGIADHPKGFNHSISDFAVAYAQFGKVETAVEQQMADAALQSSTTAGVGVAAGAATALLGPTAAMAVATTFGTASTGTAIATLSGAAATNAALAWIGGGALAAGGGGMSGGGALLALAGPVGWGLAAVAAAGGVGMYSFKNGKLAKEASEKAEVIESQRSVLDRAVAQIGMLRNLTKEHADGVRAQLAALQSDLPASYNDFSAPQLRALGALINHVYSLSMLLNRTLEAEEAELSKSAEANDISDSIIVTPERVAAIQTVGEAEASAPLSALATGSAKAVAGVVDASTAYVRGLFR